MQRIAVDMDGVLANVTEHFLDYDEKDFGRRQTWEDIAGKPELTVFPNLRKYLFQDNFFRTAPVMPDSQQVLHDLTKKYQIFIVSAATEFPQSLAEKQAWLNEHFPFIQWQQMVFCGWKTIIDADIMIDDHFKNLDAFSNKTFLFSQSHNVSMDAGRHQRVSSWKELAGLL
jgi:5'(3')-deoxyribonucleotidase